MRVLQYKRGERRGKRREMGYIPLWPFYVARTCHSHLWRDVLLGGGSRCGREGLEQQYMAPERSTRKTKGTEAMTCRRQPRDGRLDVLKSCSMKQFLHLEASWFLRLEQYGLEERAEGMENPEQARADLDIEQEFGRRRDKAGGREEVDVSWTSSWWEGRKINMGAHHLTLLR
ncbi:hypothetical protein B0H19DRAFT_1244126 [Mycena capillaripes]|nr:hypothetical protein B0H19DRAFT_1244126 [Mycena capillaripes]